MKSIILLVPNLMQGGQERIAVNTAEILCDEYNVKLVLFDGRERQYKTRTDIVDLNVPVKSGKFAKVVNVVRRVVKLRTLKRKLRCDLVYSFGTSANIVNCLCGGPGKRFLSVRGFESTRLTLLDRILYRSSDKIMCVSKLIKDEIDKKYPYLNLKTEVLYNPYDFDDIVEYGKEAVTDFPFDKPTVVSSGRLNRVKNFPRLIKAFSIVSSQMDCRLLIIGEGEERNRLEGLTKQYGLEDKVCLMGFRDNPFKYLSKSSLYVLSSYTEGFPNALVEGMIFLPVVSVDCKSGPSEILTDGISEHVTGYRISDYGILVEDVQYADFTWSINNDDRILADAIIAVLCNDNLRDEMKTRAYTRALEFSCDRYRKILTEFI